MYAKQQHPLLKYDAFLQSAVNSSSLHVNLRLAAETPETISTPVRKDNFFYSIHEQGLVLFIFDPI